MTGSAGGRAEDRAGDRGGLGVGVEAQAGQPVEQLREHDARLHAGEVQAEAHVRTPREREVLARRPEDVELLGVVPHLLVVVRGTDVDGDERTRGHEHAFDLGVARRGAHDADERRLPAQAFLDRLRHQRAVGAQRVELLGVREQAVQEVRRRAVRRLRAGGQQQAQERADLVVGEARALELGLREHGDHVVGRDARGARR